MQIFRVGKCNNCGACCYIYSNTLKRFHICEHYTNQSDLHCTIYEKRPKECREYPSFPMDLERVAKWCSYKFVDEKGCIIDPYMDKTVKLTYIP